MTMKIRACIISLNNENVYNVLFRRDINDRFPARPFPEEAGPVELPHRYFREHIHLSKSLTHTVDLRAFLCPTF